MDINVNPVSVYKEFQACAHFITGGPSRSEVPSVERHLSALFSISLYNTIDPRSKVSGITHYQKSVCCNKYVERSLLQRCWCSLPRTLSHSPTRISYNPRALGDCNMYACASSYLSLTVHISGKPNVRRAFSSFNFDSVKGCKQKEEACVCFYL